MNHENTVHIAKLNQKYNEIEETETRIKNDLLYIEENNKVVLETEFDLEDLSTNKDVCTLINSNNHSLNQINQIEHNTHSKVDTRTLRRYQNMYGYNPRIKRRYGSIGSTSINILYNNANTYDMNFIMAKQSFLAPKSEVKEALSDLTYNKRLKFNDMSYLKNYTMMFGIRFTGLYQATLATLAKYDTNNKDTNVFAKYTYDRRTMNVKPVRLGILPQYRHIQCYVPQYPISRIKRKWMIVYTHENEKNGYWRKVAATLHCIPYTMVPKKKNGVIVRYRPAFDARVVNQYCELFRANMPTMRDFDDIHSIKVLFTLVNVKNMFDNIPFAEED